MSISWKSWPQAIKSDVGRLKAIHVVASMTAKKAVNPLATVISTTVNPFRRWDREKNFIREYSR